MMQRRQLLTALAVGAGLGPLLLWLERESAEPARAAGGQFPFSRTEDEWRRKLPPERFRILRGHATERPFSSPLDHEKRPGTFVCAGCGHPLFASTAKFDSGTGWPSFWQPLDGAVGTTVDRSLFMVRTEVHCANCGGHLGHVFDDGPRPTGLRYCMNGLALVFKPQS
jgi:peptide-methionine (R)-S-oxide reductase